MPNVETPHDALTPGTIVTNASATGDFEYEIRSVISADSDFSIVYRVFDKKNGDDAVLKEFFPHADVRRLDDGRTVRPRLAAQAPVVEDALRRFRREGELLRRVNHPNVVCARGSAFDANGTSYLAMDLIDGQTLQALIGRIWDPVRPTVPVAVWAQGLLNALLDALEALHAQGIVHRDIKPANIITPLAGIRGDPRGLVLIDFGSALQLDGIDSGQTKTIDTSKSVLRERGGHTRLPFTPEYAPPEIALRQLVRPVSDLYSVGATFYELITGEKPVPANHRQQYVLSDPTADPQGKLESRPELKESYPPKWLSALDQTLSLREGGRPSNVDALRQLIQPPAGRVSSGDRRTVRWLLGIGSGFFAGWASESLAANCWARIAPGNDIVFGVVACFVAAGAAAFARRLTAEWRTRDRWIMAMAWITGWFWGADIVGLDALSDVSACSVFLFILHWTTLRVRHA
jgi:hypothetical protein